MEKAVEEGAEAAVATVQATEEVEVMETLDHLEMVEEMMIVTRFLRRQLRVSTAQEEF